MRSKGWLWIEFAAVFWVMPAVFVWLDAPVHLFPALWVWAGVCLWWLLRDRSFDRGNLWRADGVRRAWRGVLGVFIPAAAALTLWAYTAHPDRFFHLPRNRPQFWAVIMLLYPVLSVYPQNLIHRAFLFHRYRTILPRPWMRVLIGAAAFGWAHIVMENFPAVALTFLGGLLFGWTYERTRSLLAASLEHAMYGCWVFTVGLGFYFVHGWGR